MSSLPMSALMRSPGLPAPYVPGRGRAGRCELPGEAALGQGLGLSNQSSRGSPLDSDAARGIADSRAPEEVAALILALDAGLFLQHLIDPEAITPDLRATAITTAIDPPSQFMKAREYGTSVKASTSPPCSAESGAR